MRILLATDGSATSDAAVAELARRPVPPGSEIRVISVVEPPIPEVWPDVDMTDYNRMQKTIREKARGMVEEAAAKLRAGNGDLNVSTKILSGSPKRSILEEAEKFEADLIVVGSHGHGVIGRFLLGSVSQAVALHAPCSVEIVRSPKMQAAGDQ